MKNSISKPLAFLTEYVNLAEVFGDGAVSETHQIGLINDTHRFSITAKSRRIGFSVGTAKRSYGKAATIPNHESIFISISQTEASEKIRIVNRLWHATLLSQRPKKVVDNKTHIEFENGSRIISLPCKASRGYGEADIYLDEFARSGELHIGSSVLGAQGLFWEIFTEPYKRYPLYKRRLLPWWCCEGLCTDIRKAVVEAPHMSTYNRVHMFGTPGLLLQFEGNALLSFQQEFECMWQDATLAWLTWDDIKRNQEWAMSDRLEYQYADCEPHMDFYDIQYEIDQAAAWAQANHFPPMYGGYDVGRKKHLSELTLVSYEVPPTTPYRLGLTLQQQPFDVQKQVISYVLDTLPIEGLFIDASGLGMDLAEHFENEYPDVCEGVTFTNELKQELAVGTKLQFERQQSPIPLDRELGTQLHSIQRRISAANNLVFDAQRNAKNHADRFWSLALAHKAVGDFEGIGEGVSPVYDYRG